MIAIPLRSQLSHQENYHPQLKYDTFLNIEDILDKEFILNAIKTLDPKINIDKTIEFSITNKSNLVSIFFDSKTYNLSGWKTKDVYQNEVIFKINNLEKNIKIDKDQFKLPSLN